MQLIKQSKPFTIPVELKEIFSSMKLEYGTGGGVGEVLRASRFWGIGFADGKFAGYTWLNEHSGPDGTKFHINIAVQQLHALGPQKASLVPRSAFCVR